jgi:hypothetical protein
LTDLDKHITQQPKELYCFAIAALEDSLPIGNGDK